MRVQPDETQQAVSQHAEEKATPIIVIGMNRSGTKWLSNELAAHPQIISVQHERHYGIVETNLFGALASQFDLRAPDDYVGLVELWSKTDFFELTGADKALFYRLRPRPSDAYALFRVLMDDYARRHHRAFWLQKAAPIFAPEILAHYRDARVVIIKREIIGTLRSQLRLHLNRGRTRALSRAVVSYVLQDKVLQQLRREYPVVFVRYEDLVAEKDRQIERICEHLGIEYTRASEEVVFRKNTSFKGTARKEAFFTRRQQVFIKSLAALLYLVPLPALRALRDRFGDRQPRLLPGTFAGLRERYGIT